MIYFPFLLCADIDGIVEQMIQNIEDSVTDRPNQLQSYENKYFMNAEQQDRQNHSDTSGARLDVRDRIYIPTGLSATELISSEQPASVAIDNSSAVGSYNSKHSTTPPTKNIRIGEKQLIISRVTTHSGTLAPSSKLNKIFDTLSAASKHHHHDLR